MHLEREGLWQLDPLREVGNSPWFVLQLSRRPITANANIDLFPFSHACRSLQNIWPTRRMIGGRLVMMYVASRDIQVGEQLFTNYGRNYFQIRGILCSCDDSDDDHLPPPLFDGDGSSDDGGNGTAPKGASGTKPEAAPEAAPSADYDPWLIGEVSLAQNGRPRSVGWRRQAMRNTTPVPWTRNHWERLNELLQTFRFCEHEGVFVNRKGSVTYNPSVFSAQVSQADRDRMRNMFGQLVTLGGESMRLKWWHIDAISAFNQPMEGRIRWSEDDLAKRIFSILLTEERKRLRLARRINVPTLVVDR